MDMQMPIGDRLSEAPVDGPYTSHPLNCKTAGYSILPERLDTVLNSIKNR